MWIINNDLTSKFSMEYPAIDSCEQTNSWGSDEIVKQFMINFSVKESIITESLSNNKVNDSNSNEEFSINLYIIASLQRKL